jgi:hypothetical protein
MYQSTRSKFGVTKVQLTEYGLIATFILIIIHAEQSTMGYSRLITVKSN